jgi:GH24 family phage-related lysozyme (muramidase)
VNNHWDRDCWKFVDHQEGNPLKAYWDVDSFACGRGIHGPDINQNTIWTAEESDQRFKQRLDENSDALNSILKVQIPQQCFNACVSIRYNNKPKDFDDSTLLKKINSGDMTGAADEFPKWCHKTVDGVKVVDKNLLDRRNLERAMFLSGIGGLMPEETNTPSPTPTLAKKTVGATTSPGKKVKAAKPATKIIIAVIGAIGGALQDPTVQEAAKSTIIPFMSNFVHAHLGLSAAIGTLITWLVLIHDPNPKAQ